MSKPTALLFPSINDIKHIMNGITVPESLPELVSERFQAAKQAGDLLFWDSEVALLNVNGISYQLRYCPTLKSKPKGDLKKAPGEKAFNPFLNPPKELFISPIGDSHVLVLNKFALVPDHSILATKSFARQIDLLEESDLAATYALIHAYKNDGKRLFGFFNCGEHSGASQPHRHIQFLPVDAMKTGLASTQMWVPLTDQLLAGQAKIPFTYFSAPISQKATPKQLHDTYMALHKLACYAVEKYIARNPDGGMSMNRELEKTGATPISYNLAFTDSVMVILPRRAEGMAFPTGLPEPEPQETGFVALNGTVLGGTLLVKDILEWDALRGDGGKLKIVLERIGIPFSACQGEILGWKAMMPSQSL